MRFLLLLPGLCLLPATASAINLEAGDLSLSFAPSEVLPEFHVSGFATFTMYTLTNSPPGDLLGFEFSVSVPPEMTILQSHIDVPNLPCDPDCEPGNYVVSTAGCFAPSGVTRLVSFTAIITSVSPGAVETCLGPALVSSFTPAAPGYLDCQQNQVPFGLVRAPYLIALSEAGCVIINETAVSTSATSWGGVKARF